MNVFDFLFQNSWLLILGGIWLVSALGNLATRAARKAAEEQQRQRRGQQPQAARPRQPDPDQIAAEIRRVMGLEEPPKQAPEPTEWEVEEEDAVREPVRVREMPSREMPSREMPSRVAPAELEPMTPATASRRLESITISALGGGIARPLRDEPHMSSAIDRRPTPGSGLRRGRRRGRPRARRGILDLSNPAAAIVLREVLGPPRGMER